MNHNNTPDSTVREIIEGAGWKTRTDPSQGRFVYRRKGKLIIFNEDQLELTYSEYLEESPPLTCPMGVALRKAYHGDTA